MTLHCGKCGQHFMLCGCEGLGVGEDMYFVLPTVADDMPFALRLERWATLVKMHPQLVNFDATQMVMDYPSTITDDFKTTRPIFEKLMDEYKQSDALKELEHTMKIPSNEWTEVLRNCNLAMDNLFSGNWGQIKLFEYVLLNNAFRESKPTDFEPNLRKKIQYVLEAVCGVLDMYNKLGVRDLNWQLEDCPRPKC